MNINMKSREEIQNWLREKIAEKIKLPVSAVEVDVPFANYGLDSILLVTLVDELEEWLGTSLDPTIFWEYPTIEILTEWLLSADASKH